MKLDWQMTKIRNSLGRNLKKIATKDRIGKKELYPKLLDSLEKDIENLL